MYASPLGVRRVIVVVLDGLRPDAISRFNLQHIERLSRGGAHTHCGITVSPSVTAAAMTSLFTGVTPTVHGVESDRFHVPSPRRALTPITELLADAGLPSSAFLAEIPFIFRGLARRFARTAGVGLVQFAGHSSAEILLAARSALTRQRRGLILFHWPDADRAGHEHGWMSAEYGDAARCLDASLGLLAAIAEIGRDPGTLLVALADHGGGGMVANDHNSPHPLDRTIPIVLAGSAVASGELAPFSSLIDVPATVLWALGVAVPPDYEGRVLLEAFAEALVAA